MRKNKRINVKNRAADERNVRPKSLTDPKIYQAVGDLNEAVMLLEDEDFDGALEAIVLAWQTVMIKRCQM